MQGVCACGRGLFIPGLKSAGLSSPFSVMREESQDQVQKALEAFPLYPYVRELAIVPLVKM